MDVQYQACTYGNGSALIFYKVLGLAYERTDSNVTTKFFEIVGFKFSEVWGSARTPSARRSSAITCNVSRAGHKFGKKFYRKPQVFFEMRYSSFEEQSRDNRLYS